MLIQQSLVDQGKEWKGCIEWAPFAWKMWSTARNHQIARLLAWHLSTTYLIWNRDFLRCTFVKNQMSFVWNAHIQTKMLKSSLPPRWYNRCQHIFRFIYRYIIRVSTSKKCQFFIIKFPTPFWSLGIPTGLGLCVHLCSALAMMRSSEAENMQHSSGWTRPARSRRPRRRRWSRGKFP